MCPPITPLTFGKVWKHFDCDSWGGRYQPGVPLNLLQCTTQPPQIRNFPGPNVSGVAAENHGRREPGEWRKGAEGG